MRENDIDCCNKSMMPFNDLHSLRYLFDHLPLYSKIVEVGCWAGYTTVHLGTWAKAKGGHVYVVDTFNGRGSILEDETGNPLSALKSNLKKFKLEDTVTIIKSTSDDALEKLPKDVNMVFIDGDHRYNQIKKDIINYKKITSGIICGHDFNGYVYEEQYINEDFVEGRHHGVSKAVQEEFDYPKALFDSIWFDTTYHPAEAIELDDINEDALSD